MKTRVLFVCIHNSARSQMAEALLREIGGEEFEAESAGIEPGTLNTLAVSAMAERGIDISKSPTRKVFDLYKAGRHYHYVITVCDEASAERCPIFPGITKRLHWSFADPSSFQGEWDSRLSQTIAVRDEIEARVKTFVAEVKAQVEVKR